MESGTAVNLPKAPKLLSKTACGRRLQANDKLWRSYKLQWARSESFFFFPGCTTV